MKKYIITLAMLIINFYLLNAQISDPWKQATILGGGTTLVCKVQVNGMNASTDDRIIAIVDNQIRAKTTLVTYNQPVGGVGRTFLIQSITQGETIKFKLWRYSEQAEYSTSYTLTSNPGGTVGSFPNNVMIINFNIRGYTASGSISFNNNPLSNISISVLNSNPDYIHNIYTTLKTNSSGIYMLPGITPGSAISFAAVNDEFTFYPPSYNFINLQNDVNEASFSADPLPVYTISGTISYGIIPVQGVSIYNTTTNTDGFFSFEIVQHSNILLTPTKQGWSFYPETLYFSDITQNYTSQNFSGIPQLFSISGSTDIANVTLNINSHMTGNYTILSNDNSQYYIPNIIWGDNISIIPEKEGYTFSPAIKNFPNITTSQIHNFSAIINTYTVNGAITLSNNPLPGVQLKSGQEVIASTNSNGEFSFPINHEESIFFYPYKFGYSFEPEDIMLNSVISDTTVSFTATEIPIYTVSGNISFINNGLENVNITIVSDNHPTSNIITDVNGNYSTQIHETTNIITITPSKEAFIFTPAQIQLEGLSDNVNDINFTANIQTFIISGNVGVSSAHLILTGDHQYNTFSNETGFFSFANIPYGSSLLLNIYKDGYNFSPSNIPFNNITQNYSNLNITPLPIVFNVLVSAIDYYSNPIPDVLISYNNIETTTNQDGQVNVEVNWGTNLYISANKQGHIFINPNQMIGPVISDSTIIFYSRERESFILSGNVSLDNNVALPNIRVWVNHEFVLTDSLGNYSKSIYEADNLTITPLKSGHQFFPSTEFIENVSGDVIANFTGTIAVYPVSGIILKDGNPLSGVTINSNHGTVISDNQGIFSFTVNHGSTISITPSYLGHHFVPITYSINQVIAPVENIIFNAQRNQYLIHGTVLLQGLPLESVRIYDLLSSNETTTNAEGQFYLSYLYGDSFTLKAEKIWHSFLPETHSRNFVNQNYHNLDYIATAICADVIVSPEPGLYYEPIQIQLTTDTENALIYYTTNGTTPTTNSILYESPILLNYNSYINLKARAYKTNHTPSAIKNAYFRVTGTTTKPTLSINSGEYFEALNVEIFAENTADIYYTLNGAIPSQSDSIYTSPIFINKDTILKAIAIKQDYLISPDTTAFYVITPLINFELPDSIFINENSNISLNFENYITNSVTGNHEYLITVLNRPENINISINQTYVSFIPFPDWSGLDIAKFQIEHLPESNVLRNKSNHRQHIKNNTIIDSMYIYVNPISLPPFIYDYFPIENVVNLNINTNQTFYVNVAYIDNINFQWFVNGLNQHINENNFSYYFNDYINYSVKVIVSNNNNYWEHTWMVTINTSENNQHELKFDNKLLGNYPNPFNPETNIIFSLAETSIVNISIYNIKGQLIEELINDMYNRGHHSVKWNSKDISSGIYFILMKTPEFHEIKKIMLLK